MASERDDDDEETLQLHTKLLNDLPRAVGPLGPDLHLYHQTSWLSRNSLLGSILIQTHFNPLPTDIFLSSFPKCGTTWLRALMFTTLNRSRFHFAHHPLLRKGPVEYFPFLDLYNFQNYPVPVTPSPRLFATHLARTLLPSSVTGCKFVYVWRDPKDVLVSSWHFMVKLRQSWQDMSNRVKQVRNYRPSKERSSLSLDQMFEMFCKGVVAYGPYWDHVLGYWNATVESPDKMLFLKYEEIQRDPEDHVKRLAEFMGVPITHQEEEDGMVKRIVEFCSFEHMTSLEVNKNGTHRFDNGYEIQNKNFFRRGEVGDWKTHLTEEMKDRVDRITHDKFAGSGLLD